MLRHAQLSDESAVARLHVESWRSAYRGVLRDEFLDGAVVADRGGLWKARFAELNRADQLILVSEEGGDLQGFACVFFDADAEWGTLIDNLHVVPGLKGKGLGRELMGAVAQHLQRSGYRQLLHLWVFEKNAAARGFYERLGGTIATRITEATPDGDEAEVLRYFWPDLSFLTQARVVRDVDRR
jgi:ribosomal protein S18 acetylase RimI-like enzyme